MEIEIVTTKKKLTKSIIEQIPHIKLEELENANILGHVILDYTTILFEIDRFEYRKAYWHWFKSGTKDICRRVGRYTQTREYNSESDRDLFMSKLEEFKKQSVQIYV